MADNTASISMEEGRSEESELDSDFEFDDDIKQGLNSLLNIPLEFMEDSSDEEEDDVEDEAKPMKRNAAGDSVEKQMEALFVEGSEDLAGACKDTTVGKDSGLENISDIELDGPESGECDTSDGELPDSPNIVVTLPGSPPDLPSNIQDMDDDSEVDLLEDYKEKEYYDSISKNINKTKPDREVVIESKIDSDNQQIKDRKGKIKENILDKIKSKDKKDKAKNKSESDISSIEIKKKLKLQKYLARLDQYRAKCMEYMTHISKTCDILKNDEKNKIKLEHNQIKSLVQKDFKLKSIVERVNKDKDTLPHGSTSSKLDKSSHSSRSEKSLLGVMSATPSKRRPTSNEKERKSKSFKKTKSKTNEVKEHKLKYQKYIQYLQSERAKCFEERLELDKHKTKSKRKHRKSKSKSPEKHKDKTLVVEKKENRPPVLSFSEFCNSRELTSPDLVKEVIRKSINTHILVGSEDKKERTLSIDSLATTCTVQSDPVANIDDDKELFITYSDLVKQDEQYNKYEEDGGDYQSSIEKDPELKSISVFTSVLFKGSSDSSGIPFLQETRPLSPKIEVSKLKARFTQSTGRDEIYDWDDNLSNISQSSFSPSRSPAPKVHNKALLNFVENQKERTEKQTSKESQKKIVKPSRSRSKSPKKERLKVKKRRAKHHSPLSISPSPPPPKARSPEIYKKKLSPSAHLKERWKDYPSPPLPPERRREKQPHYVSRIRQRSRSRTRVKSNHRSRSSSEERYYRRHRSRSRSRSRTRSRSPQPLPPSTAMVQLTGAEKRRRLKEEHERALASLRATIRKPMSTTPLSLTLTAGGDNYEPVQDNYDPVVMNEVHVPSSNIDFSLKQPVSDQLLPSHGYSYPGCTTHPPYTPSMSCEITPHYYFYPTYHYY